MRVLVTGSEGYIGSILGPFLLRRGFHVTGLDTGFYRNGWLWRSSADRFPAWINRDVRHIQDDDLSGFDAVVHLAELSNDPLGDLHPDTTYKNNYLGSVGLAVRAKRAGVSRFIYSSSCSVYGDSADEVVTESSEVKPQTAYAANKVRVERDIGTLASAEFSPVYLRNATAYGFSPRMRFDLVLNNLAGLAWTERHIRLTSDGTPWRPLVHVLDICEAIACCLEAPRDAVHNQVFNVGDSAENYQVRQIAEIIAQVFPGCDITFGSTSSDHRSYRVSFEKVHKCLPAFTCHWTVLQGAQELRTVFEAVGLTRELFESRSYTRLLQILHLIETEQVSTDLFWRVP
jgi:nucleoside-diphosphate-sugar epimerase